MSEPEHRAVVPVACRAQSLPAPPARALATPPTVALPLRRQDPHWPPAPLQWRRRAADHRPLAPRPRPQGPPCVRTETAGRELLRLRPRPPLRGPRSSLARLTLLLAHLEADLACPCCPRRCVVAVREPFIQGRSRAVLSHSWKCTLGSREEHVYACLPLAWLKCFLHLLHVSPARAKAVTADTWQREQGMLLLFFVRVGLVRVRPLPF